MRFGGCEGGLFWGEWRLKTKFYVAYFAFFLKLYPSIHHHHQSSIKFDENQPKDVEINFWRLGGGRGDQPHLAYLLLLLSSICVQNLIKIGSVAFEYIKHKHIYIYIYTGCFNSHSWFLFSIFSTRICRRLLIFCKYIL